MPEVLSQTVGRINNLLTPGIRENLIPRGLARELVWQDGEMPAGGPTFVPHLSDDLLDYGYTLLRHALVLHEAGEQLDLSQRAFERAAEAIESVVRNGRPDDPERGFHRVVAACAYHLAHFAARSYSLLPSVGGLNLTSMERVLTYLLRRALTTLRQSVQETLTREQISDTQLAARISNAEEDIDVEDVLQIGLSTSFARAVAIFDFALAIGSAAHANQAVELLAECEEAAAELNLVTSWWIAKLAKNLVEDLWDHSLHLRLPQDLDDVDAEEWSNLRALFISTLQHRNVAEIELWPSQLEAAKRVGSSEDDLVVSLPTSAGKTRIAELCILRALASHGRVIYVTPLRALSAQVERDLRETFQPLGYTVSSLYGASGKVGLDSDTLSNRDIVVSTPEKLDFALRQDPSLLDDVRLIVLDESHTIGPGEREVRYEVLIQRLLRRSDASLRRLVCLSAILPRGEQLDDFVSWIRQGEAGDAVVASWRPTRQRFGVISWRKTYARLDLDVEDEKTYITNFVQAVKVPKARTRVFPKDGGELALASAWEIVGEGRSALIFCPQKNLVASLAKKALDLHERQALTALVASTPRLERAKRVGYEWLGPDHPAVRCLDIGVAVHHAGLPKAFLRELEGLLRAKEIPVIIASPTLAQGLNLSASSLLVFHLRRGQKLMSGEEFGNVIGRAGRARVDIDGQILYVCFQPTQWRLGEWNQIKAAARERSIVSGLYALLTIILTRLHSAFNLDSEDLLEYVTNNADSWDQSFVTDSEDDEDDAGPVSDTVLASLDTAILALVERLDCGESELPEMLDSILKDSLWTRTLQRKTESEHDIQRQLLIQRAEYIWTNSTPTQRRGYFASGVGFATGRLLDDHAVTLNQLMLEGEQALSQADVSGAIDRITGFARIVFEIPPFAPKSRPDNWEEVLSAWATGEPMAQIVAANPEALVEFIDDAIVYRLVWALEAIRVRSVAHQDEYAELLTGSLSGVLEAGTTDPCAVLLIHAGLGSRIAALAALKNRPASFTDLYGMNLWLDSDDVVQAGKSEDWPTPATSDLWQAFITATRGEGTRKWSVQSKTHAINWAAGYVPAQGEEFRIRNKPSRTEVCTPDYEVVGVIKPPISHLSGLLFAKTSANPSKVDLIYHGPGKLK